MEPVDGSVSVSLSPSGTLSGSGDFSFCFCSSALSVSLALPSSATNQLIDHHKPPHINDRTIKWTLYVARRRHNRRNWRQAKEALVATSRVEVGPGTKTLFQSSSKKDAISRRDVGLSTDPRTVRAGLRDEPRVFRRDWPRLAET